MLNSRHHTAFVEPNVKPSKLRRRNRRREARRKVYINSEADISQECNNNEESTALIDTSTTVTTATEPTHTDKVFMINDLEID